MQPTRSARIFLHKASASGLRHVFSGANEDDEKRILLPQERFRNHARPDEFPRLPVDLDHGGRLPVAARSVVEEQVHGVAKAFRDLRGVDGRWYAFAMRSHECHRVRKRMQCRSDGFVRRRAKSDHAVGRNVVPHSLGQPAGKPAVRPRKSERDRTRPTAPRQATPDFGHAWHPIERVGFAANCHGERTPGGLTQPFHRIGVQRAPGHGVRSLARKRDGSPAPQRFDRLA